MSTSSVNNRVSKNIFAKRQNYPEILLTCRYGHDTLRSMIDEIVTAIRAKQAKDKLYDHEIARTIGVACITWKRVKHGRGYGRKFLDGVKKAYPDIFLPTDATQCSK